jgi:hypothetical protein
MGGVSQNADPDPDAALAASLRRAAHDAVNANQWALVAKLGEQIDACDARRRARQKPPVVLSERRARVLDKA